MFLLSDLVNQVRELVLDLETPYRYSDARIYRAINSAYIEAYGIRPDIFVDLKFKIPFVVPPVPIPPTAPANPGLPVPRPTPVIPPQQFQLDQQYFNAFVDYVVSRIEFSDDEWTVDGRAMTFLSLFVQRLRGAA